MLRTAVTRLRIVEYARDVRGGIDERKQEETNLKAQQGTAHMKCEQPVFGALGDLKQNTPSSLQ